MNASTSMLMKWLIDLSEINRIFVCVSCERNIQSCFHLEIHTLTLHCSSLSLCTLSSRTECRVINDFCQFMPSLLIFHLLKIHFWTQFEPFQCIVIRLCSMCVCLNACIVGIRLSLQYDLFWNVPLKYLAAKLMNAKQCLTIRWSFGVVVVFFHHFENPT